VSPPPNWSPQGRAARDLSTEYTRAPKSAFKVHRHQAWQPFAVIGHPLPLLLTHRRDHIKDSEKVKRTALPLPQARRITGRGRKTDEPAL
jgi:hypothetical protein